MTTLRRDTLPDLPDAACRAGDPREYDKLFFLEDRPSKRVKQAIAMICGSCPARLRCLSWALENNELGVWGGTTREQRKAALPPSPPRPTRRDLADQREARRDLVRKLHADGLNCGQIAREIGCSDSAVHADRRALGLPDNFYDREGVAARRARIAELHAQGLRDCDIARSLDIADKTVRMDRARLGLEANRKAS